MSEQTHWGPDPGHGGLTQHKGSRANCSGPDCGSDEGSHFHQATQRLEASDWQWQEHGFKGALREAIVAQVHSNLAVAFELRRLNEDRSQWYREVLEVLSAAKNGDGSPVGSGQPAAAPDGQASAEPRACGVCGKEDVLVICTSEDGPLTRAQWYAHHEALYYQSQENGANKTSADDWATSRMNEWFGPCPEES